MLKSISFSEDGFSDEQTFEEAWRKSNEGKIKQQLVNILRKKVSQQLSE
jgi:hypothetical protein